MRISAFRFCAFSLLPIFSSIYAAVHFFLAGKLREAVETSTIAVIFHLTTVKGFLSLFECLLAGFFLCGISRVCFAPVNVQK